ncbi:hypothetical protein ACFOET_15615 [Parapedobacter deserti]|uniref:Uncharacterized protein n=1 Tax=Parapedobacter deserti TaxID=1912957 RepID=A0ABV7JPE6_9SPHI
MKTSSDKFQFMEDCLLGRAPGTEQALFQASLLVDPDLREDAYWQSKTYAVIREFGRAQFRTELEQLHLTLFTAPQHRSFRHKVLGFFGK